MKNRHYIFPVQFKTDNTKLSKITRMKRYLLNFIKKDLEKKMVFVGGPRQVGKTTMALSLIPEGTPTHPAYINWDSWDDKEALSKGHLPLKEPLIILDEIHKYPKWRNLVKGLYDKNHHNNSFIVTGSARLDYYSKGGDSLLGRYHYYRLHPLTLGEISNNPTQKDVEHLLEFGGFPEPFLSGRKQDWRRWQKERTRRVINEDLRDLENVREIGLLEVLASALTKRVGAPLSLNSIKEDLGVAHGTVDKWISILDNIYWSFRIPPYGTKKIRAVKKEKKLYLWDWSICPEPGPRFENMVANHLLKYCHFVEDTEGFDMELNYLRDREGREVDFLVLKEGEPLFAVECKSSDREASKTLLYFKDRLTIPECYQVHLGIKDYGEERSGVRVLPFHRFSKEKKLN